MNNAIRFGVILFGAAVAAACASSKPSPEQEAREAQKQESIDKILSEPLGAEEYAHEERCLGTFDYRNIDVVDDEHVVFRGSGDKLWLNTLRQRCLGLRRDDTLRFQLRDNRVCDLDNFDAVDYSFGFIPRTSGTCTLGKFAPISREQLDAIETAVEQARRR